MVYFDPNSYHYFIYFRSALGIKTKFFTKAMVGYAAIINGIKESPNYQNILTLAEKRSVKEVEAINNIIFTIM